MSMVRITFFFMDSNSLAHCSTIPKTRAVSKSSRSQRLCKRAFAITLARKPDRISIFGQSENGVDLLDCLWRRSTFFMEHPELLVSFMQVWCSRNFPGTRHLLIVRTALLVQILPFEIRRALGCVSMLNYMMCLMQKIARLIWHKIPIDRVFWRMDTVKFATITAEIRTYYFAACVHARNKHKIVVQLVVQELMMVEVHKNERFWHLFSLGKLY